MMRIISRSETLDLPYDLHELSLESCGSQWFIALSDCSKPNQIAGFKTEEDALREMRRIRRAYEAGAKFYIIGTGDHDGPMEIPDD